MKIILEESQRLSAAHRPMRTDGDISLTDLPDLAESTNSHAPGFIKRVSSRDSGVSMLVAKTSKSSMLLKRTQSQRPSNTEMGLFSLPSNESILSSKSSSRGSFRSIDESAQDKSCARDNQEELRRRVSKNGDWQNSLKKMLAEGRDKLSVSSSLGPEVDGDSRSQQPEAEQKNALDIQDR